MNNELKGNIFHKFTARSLKANRTRTIVTVIGIMLSMSLFTAVIEGAYSGMQYLVRSEIAEAGAWEAGVNEIDTESLEAFKADREIKELASMEEVGWADIGSTNEYKPYLLINSVSDNFSELAGVKITEGRMAEKPDEIVIPEHLYDNGNVKLNVGDVITLNVGERRAGTEKLGAHWGYGAFGEEKIENTAKKTYTVVGLCKRLDWRMEGFEYPGYTALTKGESGVTGTVSAYVTLKNTRKIFSYLKKQDVDPEMIVTHNDLLYYYGISGNSGIMSMLYGLAAILVLLIVFGSVTLIYNSFSISISERTKQFGILKSIGATKKQIRSAVFYEAGLLSVVGIAAGLVVGCVGIGLTLYFLKDTFSAMFAYGEGVEMKLVISPLPLIISAAVCLVTVFISAFIPAQRAIRVSAIDSIRLSSDIKIRGKKVRTSKLTQKIFGFEGMMASKNFKRNKKQTRSVVISLFLSIVLFISASSFSAYLIDSIDGFNYLDGGYDVMLRAMYPFPGEEVLAEELAGIDSVDEYVYTVPLNTELIIPEDQFENNPDAGPLRVTYDGNIHVFTGIEFVEDREFIELCKRNKLDPDIYFDRSEPVAILKNSVSFSVWNEEKGYNHFYNVDLLKDADGEHEFTYFQPHAKEGYVYSGYKIDEDGAVKAVYGEVINKGEYEDGSGYTEIGDETEFPAEECGTVTKIVTKGEVKTDEYYIGSSFLGIIYPYSMKDLVMDNESVEIGFGEYAKYYVIASNHKAAAEDIEAMLEDKGYGGIVDDQAEAVETIRMLIRVINVFSYGFIILISLIAVANVFNTISTNVLLRRREIAMMRSIGLSNKGLAKMMNYECIIYGLKGILWGLPAALVITYLIYRAIGAAYSGGFYVPWYSLAIAIGSIFVVVFLAMAYSANKIKKDNVIDALKNENI